MPRFPRKLVSYSSTKFGILKPWTIISILVRFDLGFWQTWKQVNRTLKYREKILEQFQQLSLFPKKLVLYYSTKFGILKSWAIISKLVKFYLGLWQSSKEVYRKLKYRENVSKKFQYFPRFTIKMVLYSSTKFAILKPRNIISKLIRFNLGFS